MPLHLDILDVGQGDGMVVWLPKGKAMMVDLGSTKNKGIVTEDSFKYFRDHTPFKDGKQELEWLILTHADRDHYNMVEAFLTKFPVTVRHILHGGLEDDYGGLIGRLRVRRNGDGTTPTIATRTNGFGFPLDDEKNLGAEVIVMACGVTTGNPNHGYIKNTRSVVLRIGYAGQRIMLTGDATRDTETAIINVLKELKLDPVLNLKADVLKVAHHGSHRTSNYAEWLSLVDPSFAFMTSDRSGSLDEQEHKVTGHRLPQELTIDLIKTFSESLATDCGKHTYVSSFQKTDYETYNKTPDVPKPLLPVPGLKPEYEWINPATTYGIFSTLTKMGLGKDPRQPDAADVGVQYRVTIADNGDIGIKSTEDDFSTFAPVGKKGK